VAVGVSWNAAIEALTGNVYIKGPYTDTDLVERRALMRICAVLPNTPTNDNYTWMKGRVVR
jgi:hypothetical protein